MKLHQHQSQATLSFRIDNNTYSQTYSAAKFLLQAYITLWRKQEAAGNTYKIPAAVSKRSPAGGGDAAYRCMVRLLEAGLLAGISSAEAPHAGLEVRFSFEAISLLVERSFDFPHEQPHCTAEAIAGHFLMPESKNDLCE